MSDYLKNQHPPPNFNFNGIPEKRIKQLVEYANRTAKKNTPNNNHADVIRQTRNVIAHTRDPIHGKETQMLVSMFVQAFGNGSVPDAVKLLDAIVNKRDNNTQQQQPLPKSQQQKHGLLQPKQQQWKPK